MNISNRRGVRDSFFATVLCSSASLVQNHGSAEEPWGDLRTALEVLGDAERDDCEMYVMNTDGSVAWHGHRCKTGDVPLWTGLHQM